MLLRSFILIFFLVIILSYTSVCQLTYAQLKVEYDSAWTYKNLQLIPVRFKLIGEGLVNPVENSFKPISLVNAMATGKAKVKEVIYENGADLNWLQISNSSKQTIIINSGDLLAGGKQDRMVGETKMIAPGKSDYLKVFCVEKGRWDNKNKPFNHSGAANSNVKKVMDLSGRQHDVWQEIERQFTSANIVSKTWPYMKLYYKDSIVYNDYLKYFTGRYRDSDSAYAGFLAITANKIISCELFSSADLTSIAFPSLISSFAQTAKNESKPMLSREVLETFFDKFLLSEKVQKDFIATHGQLHKYQGKVIHLVVYDD